MDQKTSEGTDAERPGQFHRQGKKIIWPAGHIGLAVSSKAQKELWPKAIDWLAKRTD